MAEDVDVDVDCMGSLYFMHVAMLRGTSYPAIHGPRCRVGIRKLQPLISDNPPIRPVLNSTLAYDEHTVIRYNQRWQSYSINIYSFGSICHLSSFHAHNELRTCDSTCR